MIDEHISTIWPVEIAQIPAIAQAALEDKHAVFSPTDIIVKDGKTVGVLEIASTPCVFWWMHRERTNMRDALSAYIFYENVVRRAGAKHVVVPCPEHSPFYKLLTNPTSGYVELPDTKVFMKQLRQ